MGETISHPAWVEHAGGERVPIIGACSIGRAPSNAVVLNDERVSRRHAIIQAQEQGESWLADLGSSNGTYLNGRRLSEPARLADGDRIEVGPFALVFRQPGPVREPGMDPLTEDQTIPALKRATCWLLVADIVGSTRLNQALAAEQVSTLTSDWLTACKQIIAETGGSIDKFLGDGFLRSGPMRPSRPRRWRTPWGGCAKSKPANNHRFG
jgi:adenylate cyclase